METQHIVLDRARARELWRVYKTHQHWSEPIDQEIQRTYKALARGRIVIQALESIKSAGLNNQGLPRLAIVRADAERCFVNTRTDGSVRFSDINRWGRDHWHRHHVELPRGSFAIVKERGAWNAAEAIVPLVPIHLRPKRGLANYHVLWEAKWSRIVPRDPMLLRRLGRGDLWLVVAAWELTEVECAALAARLGQG